MLKENVFQWLKMPMKTNISANVITQNSAPALTAANTHTWCIAPKKYGAESVSAPPLPKEMRPPLNPKLKPVDFYTLLVFKSKVS